MMLEKLIEEFEAETAKRRREIGSGLYTATEVETLIRRTWRLAWHEGSTKPAPTIEELLAWPGE